MPRNAFGRLSSNRPLRSPLVAVALSLVVLAPSAIAQDEGGATAPTEAKETSASERHGIRPGSHRISLYAGGLIGETARTVDLVPVPFDRYNANVDLADSSLFGLRYAYQFHEHWAIEGSLARASSDLENKNGFDRAYVDSVLQQSSTPVVQNSAAILARLESHSGPRDIDVTFLDVGMSYVVNPDARWIVDAGAGIGWAWGSLADGPAVFEELVHSVRDDEADEFVIANEIDDPTNGTGCPAPDDPCFILDDGSGLTWHVSGGLSRVVSNRVHLKLGARLRFIEQVVDPGDSFVSGEVSAGVTFVLGGE